MLASEHKRMKMIVSKLAKFALLSWQLWRNLFAACFKVDSDDDSDHDGDGDVIYK